MAQPLRFLSVILLLCTGCTTSLSTEPPPFFPTDARLGGAWIIESVTHHLPDGTTESHPVAEDPLLALDLIGWWEYGGGSGFWGIVEGNGDIFFWRASALLGVPDDPDVVQAQGTYVLTEQGLTLDLTTPVPAGLRVVLTLRRA